MNCTQKKMSIWHRWDSSCANFMAVFNFLRSLSLLWKSNNENKILWNVIFLLLRRRRGWVTFSWQKSSLKYLLAPPSSHLLRFYYKNFSVFTSRAFMHLNVFARCLFNFFIFDRHSDDDDDKVIFYLITFHDDNKNDDITIVKMALKFKLYNRHYFHKI